MAGIKDERRRQWRQGFRRRRREARVLSDEYDKQIERLFIRRFDRLISVRRFIFLWVGLLVVLLGSVIFQLRGLSAYYQTLKPVPGGLYTEGLIGKFTNANPLYATGPADLAVSRLVFSGLFKYDNNNKLAPDLATSWKRNALGTSYTVQLRRGVSWQDGQPFTANDVLYTYRTIQDPLAQSALYSGWQGVNVTKAGDYTVIFNLPDRLSSFPYSLTNGIIPEHALKDIPPEQLRSAPFNTDPIGTGPFKWKFVEVTGSSDADRRQKITLAAYKKYWDGHPKLDGISLMTFPDDQQMTTAFKKKEINAMSGLESVLDDLAEDPGVQVYNTPETSAVGAFFNNSRTPLSETAIRQALVRGVDRGQLPGLFKGPFYTADGPLLRGQLGYDKQLRELSYNLKAANKLLDDAGWKRDAGGQRSKDGRSLTLGLSSQNTEQYTKVAEFLQYQWAKLGVKISVHYFNANDLQGQIIGSHNYDILLYGINIGVDPDILAYWDSSQASVGSQGLNLSEYKSKDADRALEAGRTRAEPDIRAVKYRAFLEAWRKDAPALILYQPDSIYVSRGQVFNFERRATNSSADRFYNAADWEIRQQRQTL